MNIKVSHPLDLHYPPTPPCVRKVFSQHFPHILTSFKLDCAKYCCLCNLADQLELGGIDIFERNNMTSLKTSAEQLRLHILLKSAKFLDHGRSIHSGQEKICSFCARQNPFILCKRGTRSSSCANTPTVANAMPNP